MYTSHSVGGNTHFFFVLYIPTECSPRTGILISKNSVPHGLLAMFRYIFDCHGDGEKVHYATDIQWVEIKDASQYPTMSKTFSKTENNLVQNVDNTKMEKLYPRENKILTCQFRALSDPIPL